ncbi:hypothetical protein EXIGLDRAFT_733491 [Exidia glandulosa HHB12029]|uniref:Uncharacterized protein n=1 Tax=Exidia glandulosa HHB12029 TaxID=1314781 RepID=A0A165KHS9_EXIGL|nr:hypothetical protein EXIGLDRAFT_733491 [Exidia glandulosa HHB12029]
MAVTGVGAAAQQRHQQRLPELATVANWVKTLRARLRETNIDPEDPALLALRDEVRALRRDIDGSQALLDDAHDVLDGLFDVDIPEAERHALAAKAARAFSVDFAAPATQAHPEHDGQGDDGIYESAAIHDFEDVADRLTLEYMRSVPTPVLSKVVSLAKVVVDTASLAVHVPKDPVSTRSKPAKDTTALSAELLEAVNQQPLAPEAFLLISLQHADASKQTKLVGALTAAVKGVESARPRHWIQALQNARPSAAKLEQQAQSFEDVESVTDSDTLAQKWAVINEYIATSSARAESYDFCNSVLSKILCVRFALAWQAIGSQPDASTFTTRFYAHAYMQQDAEFDELEEEERAVLLQEKSSSVKTFRTKFWKDNGARRRLLDALRSLGFMVLLDSRWSQSAMSIKQQPNWGDKAVDLGRRLDATVGDGDQHPLTLKQEAAVEGLLALSRAVAGEWLARIVDEFVRDVSDDIPFVPWSADAYAATPGSKLLRGTFARPVENAPRWSMTTRGLASQAREDTPEPEVFSPNRKRRRIV